ncbi:MAG: ADP-ribosylglycohydrolase family protein [Armatimonadetes bacterium]|nr:ADP-ribosylglycohydrolase family protein [Armatimonadota bacterium]
MSDSTWTDKMKGCLTGAAVGAELAYARLARPDAFRVSQPEEMLGLRPEPVPGVTEDPHRTDYSSALPFLALGMKVYLQKEGRALPEDFAALLKDDEDIARPVFTWDTVHTTQEILREGMHPRISGIGNVPCGYICAAMPAVGLYHFARPEYAYLDGVELASVTQPRLGADWAGLCAAAVSAAFAEGASPETIIETVLKIAHRHNKELFYDLDSPLRQLGMDEPTFLAWWLASRGRASLHNTTWYWMYNPLAFILPVLRRYGQEPRKALNLLLAATGENSLVSAVVAGAILGALHGAAALPDEWREWAEPVTSPWLPIMDITARRVEKERDAVSVVDSLVATEGTDGSLLFDKVYGCILAGAIGNAMGSPVEGRYYWEIDKAHPGGIKTVLYPRMLETEDDNQMAMLLVETYLEREGQPVMARHFGQTWHEKLDRNHFFLNCMGHCYDLIRAGWDPRITGHWTQVTGSTVMCMEPVGLYHIADPEFALADATAISYMYQRGLDNLAAGLLSVAVCEAMRPEATVDSVCQAVLNASPKTRLNTFDRRVWDNAYDYLSACLEVADSYDDVFAVRHALYEKCLLYHQIDPLELFGFSLAMLKVSKADVRQAAIGGTNIGRDSDTISGRAAMLAGTLKGGHTVPREWVALFKPEVLRRIQTNCRRLTDLLRLKNERMKERLQQAG